MWAIDPHLLRMFVLTSGRANSSNRYTQRQFLERDAHSKEQAVPTEDSKGSMELKPDQFRLLTELALFGGVQIVRHGRDRAHYDALEAMHCLKSTELSKIEISYKITSSGRNILATQPDHRVGPRNSL
jgi:hypothetical protein